MREARNPCPCHARRARRCAELVPHVAANLSRPDLVIRTIRGGAKYVTMVPVRPRVRSATLRATVYLAKPRSTWFPSRFRTHPRAYDAQVRSHREHPRRARRAGGGRVGAIWSAAGIRPRSARSTDAGGRRRASSGRPRRSACRRWPEASCSPHASRRCGRGPRARRSRPEDRPVAHTLWSGRGRCGVRRAMRSCSHSARVITASATARPSDVVVSTSRSSAMSAPRTSVSRRTSEPRSTIERHRFRCCTAAAIAAAGPSSVPGRGGHAAT